MDFPRRVDEGLALEEIEAIYRAEYARFLRTAIAILGDEHAAADAVHDGFIKAVRHRATFRRDGSAEGWLWRTVVNAARQAASTRQVVVPLEHVTSADERGNDEQTRFDGELGDLIRGLPERQRLIVFLRYCADLDYALIGETLGISAGTVAASLHAVHSKLKLQLKEAG